MGVVSLLHLLYISVILKQLTLTLSNQKQLMLMVINFIIIYNNLTPKCIIRKKEDVMSAFSRFAFRVLKVLYF